MRPASIRSLAPILATVRSEREAQLRHFDALDTKAGVILGFAGALVALAPSGNLIVEGGRAFSLASGLLALWTFWPRSYPVLELRSLRELYLSAEPEFTELHLLDAQVRMAEKGAISLSRKAWRLRYGMTALAIGAVLTAVGLGVD